MKSETLTVVDNRTNVTYTIPVENGTIKAMDLRQMKTDDDDFGLMTYDPAFMNTASCKSSITFIDGDKGILRYRGYNIDELAESVNFLDTAYLLLNGELPNAEQSRAWAYEITHHSMVHETTREFIQNFRYDAHPMAILCSTVAALSSVYPEASKVRDAENRRRQIVRLIAKMPTIAAASYRHSLGFPYVYPDNDLDYTANFMNMMWKMVEPKYVANPVLAHALDVLFVLHADHEQNASTNTMRAIGSTECDPYLATAGAAAALSGPLHGGANEAVLRMLDEIGNINNVPKFVAQVKGGGGKLMGFGHRVYKNYDPRARIIKAVADQVFQVTGKNPRIDIALELERIALQDDYFIQRKLYPNVDFYSGIILQAMGFKSAMFPVLFAIARTAGWLSQWDELMRDGEQKISRPRQVYTGHMLRHIEKGQPVGTR